MRRMLEHLEETIEKELGNDIINITEKYVLKDFGKEIKNISNNIIKETILDNLQYTFNHEYNMVYEFVSDLEKEYQDVIYKMYYILNSCSMNTRILGVILLREFTNKVIKSTRKKLRTDWRFQREGQDEVTNMLINFLEEKINK